MTRIVEARRAALLAIVAVYALVLFGSIAFLRHHAALPIAVRAGVALVPMIPALFTIPPLIARFRALDEMQARHRLEAGAIAATICAFLALTYGFLERAGFPRQSMSTVWAVLGLSWLAGSLVQRWRFR